MTIKIGILIVGLVLVGCAKPSGESSVANAATSSNKPLTLGFAQVGGTNDWRTANSRSIQEAAKAAGIVLKFSDAQEKQENQIKAIRAFIAQGVDVIAFSPVVETGWEPVLQEAKRANIPVIVSDRSPKGADDLYVAFLGSDFVAEGVAAADWLTKKTGGKATVAELTGTSGSAPANDRHRGFAEGIAKSPGMKVVFSQPADFTLAKGKEVTEALLKSPLGKTVDVIYAHNDDMALGAIQALQDAGIKPGKEVLVVSVDGTRRAFQAMKDGTLNCTVDCTPLLGPRLMELAKDAVAGKPIEHRVIMKDAVYDQSQAAALLPGRKY